MLKSAELHLLLRDSRLPQNDHRNRNSSSLQEVDVRAKTISPRLARMRASDKKKGLRRKRPSRKKRGNESVLKAHHARW